MSQLAPIVHRAHVRLAMRAARYNPALQTVEVAAAIAALVKSERALSRIHERACNVGESKRDERAEARHERAAQEAAWTLGYTASFQGDPRGPAIRLYWPGQPDDGTGLTLY